MKLITTPNLESPDDFYEALLDTHRDLPVARSHELNARLVLLLANHIGTLDVLREALIEARDDVNLVAQRRLNQPTGESTP